MNIEVSMRLKREAMTPHSQIYHSGPVGTFYNLFKWPEHYVIWALLKFKMVSMVGENQEVGCWIFYARTNLLENSRRNMIMLARRAATLISPKS